LIHGAPACEALRELLYLVSKVTFASKPMKNDTGNKKELFPKQREELLGTLKDRCEKNLKV
jgi:hypothetical protein